MKIFNLILILFLALSRSYALDDNRLLNNCQIINFIKSEIEFKKIDLSCRYAYVCSVFALNNTNNQEFFVFVPIYNSNRTKFEREIVLKIFSNLKNIKEILSSNSKSISKGKFVIKSLDFVCVKDKVKYASLYSMRDHFGLKIDPDKEKGCVYYTVASEDGLDDMHMVYESGGERKEFVFTNLPEKPIVPVEEVEKLEKKPEIKPKKTIMSQISSFFGFFTKHEEVKNEGYDYVDERTKLKEKIY